MAEFAGILAGVALQVVTALEAVSGMPIAILERTGDDPKMFWERTTEILCEKTESFFCEEDVHFMTANTNPMGFARIIAYENNEGQQRLVCALLPPVPNISPSFAATGISAGGLFSYQNLPNEDHTEAWLTLMNAARCLDREGSKFEEKRADAFATLALTLMEGDPIFTNGIDITAARFFSGMRNEPTMRWSANVGERILLDLWKGEAAQVLNQNHGCAASLAHSTNIDVPSIPRDTALPMYRCAGITTYNWYEGQSHVSFGLQGDVTDRNLHLWMYGEESPQKFWGGYYVGDAPVLGAPPKPWTPFKMFQSYEAAVEYIWQTADSIAEQS